MQDYGNPSRNNIEPSGPDMRYYGGLLACVARLGSGPLRLKPKKGQRARTPDPVLAVVGLRWTAIEPDDGHATDTPDTSSTGTREIKLRIYGQAH